MGNVNRYFPDAELLGRAGHDAAHGCFRFAHFRVIWVGFFANWQFLTEIGLKSPPKGDQSGAKLHQSGTKRHQSGTKRHQSGAKRHQFAAKRHQSGAKLHQFAAKLHQFAAKLHQSGVKLHRFAAKRHQSGAKLHRFAAKLHQFAVKLSGENGLERWKLLACRLALRAVPVWTGNTKGEPVGSPLAG